MELNTLKFPIGVYAPNLNPSNEELSEWISTIEQFPEQVKREVSNLSPVQLLWKYRPDGWDIRQVVHHCADSHMNSIIRFKLALTEEKPLIKPYREDLWAVLADSLEMDLNSAIKILEGVHDKWVKLLRNLNKNQLNQTFIHPEHSREISVKENIGLYNWHCKHHLAHIKQAIKYKGEFN